LGVVSVGLVNVTPAIVVTVSPNFAGVLPIVIGAAKLSSSCESGIEPDLEAKIFGIVICITL
jgi:hypothetical protein